MLQLWHCEVLRRTIFRLSRCRPDANLGDVIPPISLFTGQTAKFKLPPIDYADKNRCVLRSSSMGQANAARDKLYDLRQCKIPGSNAVGYDLSGVIMTGTDASKSNFRDAYFSKGYLHGTSHQK